MKLQHSRVLAIACCIAYAGALITAPEAATQWERAFGGDNMDNAIDIITNTRGQFLNAVTGIGFTYSNTTTNNVHPPNIFISVTDDLGAQIIGHQYQAQCWQRNAAVLELKGADGDIAWTTGVWNVNTGSFDLIVARINPATGAVAWVRAFGGYQEDGGTSLVQHINNDIIVGGVIQGAANNTNRDGFLARIDLNGNIIWASSYGYSANDEIIAVGLGSSWHTAGFSDSLYAIGRTNSHGSGADYDVWLLQVDAATGDFQKHIALGDAAAATRNNELVHAAKLFNERYTYQKPDCPDCSCPLIGLLPRIGIVGETYSFGAVKSDALFLSVSESLQHKHTKTYATNTLASWDAFYDITTVPHSHSRLFIAGRFNDFAGASGLLGNAMMLETSTNGNVIVSHEYGSNGYADFRSLTYSYNFLRPFYAAGRTDGHGQGAGDQYIVNVDAGWIAGQTGGSDCGADLPITGAAHTSEEDSLPTITSIEVLDIDPPSLIHVASGVKTNVCDP